MTKISIIIPVYNNFELTLQCINSINRNCKDISYEIIVSDDCSNDETNKFFESQNEIKYVRNKQNRGFAYTCNRGAEIATGEILLFLNNDILLINNILPDIIDSFKKINVGIVGAKLLYEDNTIQHAGVLIYPDKHVGHLFKNFPSDYPEANKVREVQAVTGACLAIRKNLFLKIGKFDESFINGFEDLDLCFKVRKEGIKVLYNHDISLYHFEEKTRNFIKKDSDIKNSKIITERWMDKVQPDYFLLDEGFDFKLNELCEFYIIKKNFQHIEDDLFLAIEKEPLYFDGYKKLISWLLDKKEFDLSEKIVKKLIRFEPIIDNFRIYEYILNCKKDINKAKQVRNIIENFLQQKIEFKTKVEKIYKNLIENNNYKIAKYYEEWLNNF